MANEDEKIVADYMGWTEISVEDPMNRGVFEYILLKHNNCEAHFDLNDAALCVAEMQKRGDWEQFHDFVIEWGDLLSKASFAYITAWLMSMEEGQAKNFFKAFTEWRKGIKLDPVIDKESAAYMDN